MNIASYGIILNVQAFDECVEFYQRLFQLSELFSSVEPNFRLTCLKYGDSYLMIESEGADIGHREGKSVFQNPTKLRFNVSDIDKACETIIAYGLQAEVIKNDWGSVININDPDGNPISIRDEKGFQDQIEA